MEDHDLSNIVLLFTAVQGMSEVLSLSDNRRFLIKPPKHSHEDFWREGHGRPHPTSAFALSFGQHIFSPQGWVFGSSSDTDVCDFQLTDGAQTTVSRRHFRVDIEPHSHRPRLTLLSSNPIQVHVEDERRKRKPVIPLDQGANLELKDVVVIDLGEVQLRAWQPKLSAQETMRYKKNAEQFSVDYMDSILRLPLNLRTQGTSTFTMRFGSKGACYKVDDTGTGRAGSFASVSRLKDIRTGKVYAAKVPHFRTKDAPSRSQARWETLKAEFDKISSLHHVSAARSLHSSYYAYTAAAARGPGFRSDPRKDSFRSALAGIGMDGA